MWPVASVKISVHVEDPVPSPVATRVEEGAGPPLTLLSITLDAVAQELEPLSEEDEEANIVCSQFHWHLCADVDVQRLQRFIFHSANIARDLFHMST